MNQDAVQVQSVTVEATVMRAGRCKDHEHLAEAVPCAACAAVPKALEPLGVIASFDSREEG